ncbi:Calcium-binding protein 39-like [Sesamum angolense]|uniref:Calcium-binding protein 39-like n=1 Tax=Sesamum angolense TaxID=2727404 RepID=A0AAE1W863_9LAMI|nr:Calcium-binding protein 39-like [Sesamum angolense]
MSFFFRQSRPKTPQELVKAIKDSLMALDSQTVAEVKALEKALEEVEKNIVAMRVMLIGDGEAEPSADQISQLTLEICNQDAIPLLFDNLPILGWETRKILVQCWSLLLKQKVDSVFCCAQYMENHLELLDFLLACYDNKEIAVHCGNMLRECIKVPTLAKYIIDSPSFELFFKFVELPNFDVSSDAFATFKDLLTKHPPAVSEFLTAHYNEFFEHYEKLLMSANYVTRRQSLKLLSEFLLESRNSHIMKRYIAETNHLKLMMILLKIFVANPNKPQDIKVILAKNHEKLLALLQNLSPGKGDEDDEFEEEKEMIMKEIQRLARLPNLIS